MADPKVSIIIPIYNTEKYLEKCLDSLFNQTLNGLEFIFVDDCSTDKSVEIIQEVVNQYPLIKDNVKIVFHKTNKGVATVRNTGLMHAQGEYVGWVDSDDWIALNMYEELYNKAIIENAEIVWCDYINIYDSGIHYVNQMVKEESIEFIKAMMDGRLLGGMCNKLVKRNVYINHNISFPDGLNMCEDMRVNVQLVYYSKKIAYLDKGLYNYIKYKSDSISAKAVQGEYVNYQWIENVQWIVNFLEKYCLEINRFQLNKFKLNPKKNLLIKGQTIQAFKKWKNIFPESNKYVKYTNYPKAYKYLAHIVDKEYWALARLWIFIKYSLFKK